MPESLNDKLATRKAETVKKAPTIADFLKRMEPEIRRAVPKAVDPERMSRIALTTIRSNPALMECTVPSLLAAVMQGAQLGLEPGLLGHCYFVPFNVKIKTPGAPDRWEKQVQFQIGYRGYLDLIRRSGQMQSISAHEVYEGDLFQFEYGLDEKLIHKPALDGDPDPAKITYVYAVAKFKDGGYQVLVMSRKQVEAIRARSKSGNFGPWTTDYAAMARKTVLKQIAKYLPLSVEQQRQIAQDETIKTELAPDMLEVPSTVHFDDTAEVESGEPIVFDLDVPAEQEA